MMLAKKEAVIGTEQDRGVVDYILPLKLLPYRADVAIVIFDADVVVFYQFFQRSRIVAVDLRVANLVVGIGHGARFSRIVFQILVEGWRLRYRHSIEIV